jgi:hypothetical protein
MKQPTVPSSVQVSTVSTAGTITVHCLTRADPVALRAGADRICMMGGEAAGAERSG